MNFFDRFIFRLMEILGLLKIIFNHEQLKKILPELIFKFVIILRQSEITKIVLIGIEESGLNIFDYFSKIDFSEYGIDVLAMDTIVIKSYGKGVISGEATVKKTFPTELIEIIETNINDKKFAVVYLDDMSETGGTLKKARTIAITFSQSLNIFFCYL